jgi:hypothetical protein
MVQFENLETATAAAQEVLVGDQLDSSLDWDSFALDAIEVGGRRISIPEGARSFKTELDLRPEMPAIVEIDAHLNRATGRLECLFRGRDPLTGELADFLPPNSSAVAPRGEAWLSFSVKPKASLPTGTVIRNKATIDFEVGVPPEPMDTAEVWNTLDSVPPTSLVGPLAAEQPTSFVVRWSGQDDVGGSGLQDYSLLVSDNGGPVAPWLTRTPETWGAFQGTLGHTYAFYSTAADRVGNREPVRSTADTVVEVTSEGALLSVLRAGNGSGTVTSATPGIDCGADCTETYAPGATVTLTAVAESGSAFDGWSDACSGTGACEVTMDVAKSIRATFSLVPVTYVLAVTKAGGGTGTVTSVPAGIDCGSDCTESYDAATSVTLTATASGGSRFAGWSGGGCTGTGQCTVVMDSDTSVTATFWPIGGFFSVPPCRIVDTRGSTGTFGGPALVAGADRVFPLAGQCGIPATAQAVAVNLTVTQATAQGNLRLYPAGVAPPLVSSINYVAGQTRANNAIAALNSLGELAVRCSQASGTAHFILDVNGYFE